MNGIASVRHRPASIVVAVFLAIAVVASACASDRSPPVGEPTGAESATAPVTSIRSLSELRDRFNEDTGEVRLILLLSPT